MYSFFFGYISAAIIVTPTLILAEEITNWMDVGFFYLFGLLIAVQFLWFIGPIFLLLSTVWIVIGHKKPKLDESWRNIFFFCLFIGIIGLILTYLMNWYAQSLHSTLEDKVALLFFIQSFFFGSWFGTLLPRILVKSLKPGKLIK